MEIKNFDIIPNSPLTDVISKLNATMGEKMVIILGRNSAYFDGRIKSTLEEGDRILVIKKDLSIVLHGPLGVKPLNWQKPQAGPITFKKNEDRLEMFTERTKTKETLSIIFSKLEFVSIWHAHDESDLAIIGDESDLIKYLVSNPDLIEEGFTILKTEYNTDMGPVDIRGYGELGEAIIEVKKRKATPADAHQLKRYIEYFQEVEKKQVRGILVAPDFPDKVKNYLHKHRLEMKIIKWEEIFPLIKRPKITKLDEFIKD
jgi:RecB family endonuclease NucS